MKLFFLIYLIFIDFLSYNYSKFLILYNFFNSKNKSKNK